MDPIPSSSGDGLTRKFCVLRMFLVVSPTPNKRHVGK